MKGWHCLYFLIKRLEFRKNYLHKKKHIHTFKSTIIDMAARPPSQKPALQMGGKLFYRDLDEFDFLMETTSVEFINAQHIEPSEFITILSPNIDLCISQKVDGVLRKDIEMTSIVPKINNDYYDLVKFDGEYIEELELYLIFWVHLLILLMPMRRCWEFLIQDG